MAAATRLSYPTVEYFMDCINRFLAHAIALEGSAAGRYEDLANSMSALGDAEVAAFFRQMAEFARMHQAEAIDRAGFRDVEQPPEDGYEWGPGESPEDAAWAGVDSFLDVTAALELALEAERSSEAFYRRVARETSDAEVRGFAESFAEEEVGHVNALLARLERRASV